MSDRTPGPVKATDTAEVVSAVPNHPPTHICTCGDADVHGNPVDQANAEFVALAWNHHANLVAALKELLEVNGCGCGDECECRFCRAKALIVKVEGGAA